MDCVSPSLAAGRGRAAGLELVGRRRGPRRPVRLRQRRCGEAEYDRSDRFAATLVAGAGTELVGTLVFDPPGGLDSVSHDDAVRVNGWAGTEGLAMRPVNQL
ncbi:hypothetical protein ACIRD6_18625 [Streptomyces sp. NPDC102473]|uniref:hypothetical protein n=1 Tax=Streptomyces sp. NPDC102473 TaxID=3366180 RepID=UPI003830976F